MIRGLFVHVWTADGIALFVPTLLGHQHAFYIHALGTFVAVVVPCHAHARAFAVCDMKFGGQVAIGVPSDDIDGFAVAHFNFLLFAAVGIPRPRRTVFHIVFKILFAAFAAVAIPHGAFAFNFAFAVHQLFGFVAVVVPARPSAVWLPVFKRCGEFFAAVGIVLDDIAVVGVGALRPNAAAAQNGSGGQKRFCEHDFGKIENKGQEKGKMITQLLRGLKFTV